MNKLIGLILIAIAAVGFFVISSPIEKTDTPQTVVKKYAENKQTEVAQEAAKQVMNTVSQQTLDSACKDPNSSWCSSARTYAVTGNLTLTIIIAAIAIGGILGLVKVIIPILEKIL